VALVAFLWAGVAAFAQEVHFSPEENLETIDAALIDSAKRSIDLACYIITDKAIVDALAAADRAWRRPSDRSRSALAAHVMGSICLTPP
jgi:phosphatidylserine/phosphatidylglycerophosphate/cardiolipin synthase-like enzyme